MRRARLRAPPDQASAVYHCFSRVVDRRPVFQDAQKEHLAALLRECEEFCEVRVLTFALMSNHFHLLLEVPRRPDSLPGAELILQKLQRLSGHQDVQGVRQRLEAFRQAGDRAGEAAYLERFHRRLWDLSFFMKLFKQRLTQWHNARCRPRRHGTLWEGRFSSVLVEGAGRTLAAMAAYIDLNPVRAGIVKDPKDYRWCGYAQGMAGGQAALAGLASLVSALQGAPPQSPTRCLEIYRTHLYLSGDARRAGIDEQGRPLKASLSAEEAAKVLLNKGRLPLADYLRCRVRYFCDGVAFGGREFVESVFQRHRDRFGPQRKTGARPLRGLAADNHQRLFTVRDLRLRVFG